MLIMNVVCIYLCNLIQFLFDKYLGMKNINPSAQPSVININKIDIKDTPSEQIPKNAIPRYFVIYILKKNPNIADNNVPTKYIAD